MAGFEPATSRIRTELSSQVEVHPEKVCWRVRTPRVELGWDAYKTSWLDRSRVRRVGHLRVERSASSLSGSSGQPARPDPKCQRTDSNRQRTRFKLAASADWATLAIAGANGGIRTPTMQCLKLPPLPIGLRSRLLRGERIAAEGVEPSRAGLRGSASTDERSGIAPPAFAA